MWGGAKCVGIDIRFLKGNDVELYLGEYVFGDVSTKVAVVMDDCGDSVVVVDVS